MGDLLYKREWACACSRPEKLIGGADRHHPGLHFDAARKRAPQAGLAAVQNGGWDNRLYETVKRRVWKLFALVLSQKAAGGDCSCMQTRHADPVGLGQLIQSVFCPALGAI